MLQSAEKLVSTLLKPLPKRQQEVLEGRYGLKNGREMTLAALGKRYGVTRERIRQIQNLGLNELRRTAKQNGLAEFGDTVAKHLDKFGGARKEADLATDVAYMLKSNAGAPNFANNVKFLLDASGAAAYTPEDKDVHAYWYSDADASKKLNGYVAKLVKILSINKSAVLDGKKFGVYFADAAKGSGLNDNVALNLTSISKKFTANHYGDVGLSAWSEINPKTSRDWAYLVLKREQKPLHFTTLAERINNIRQRKTNYQTVHNELIKDERFVLVGRGTYGLREFGIMPGTAKEVMATLLKTHGPMRSHELVKLVLTKRMFKENTLLLNLQNREHFQRMSDGRYNIKEV